MPFKPNYSLTISITKGLMEIQEAATLISQLPLPAYILKELKYESQVETVIYSTKIEGNLLAEKLKREAIDNASNTKEEKEVHNLWRALEFLEECEERNLPITEELIKKLHPIIHVIPSGRRANQYRTVQNKVGDSAGRIVYLPPEAQDVPLLMEDLVAWVNNPENMDLPVPIRAGIFLFQFLTIHPFMDGNGRTGRALATFLLRLGGLGLKGLFVLEKYYDRNLRDYYGNLQLGLHNNYYFGRNNADLTPWLEFFISGVSEVFQAAAKVVSERSKEFLAVEPKLLKALDAYQRPIFAQLAFKNDRLSTKGLSKLTGFADRTIREKIKIWFESGFIDPADLAAQRIRSVKLTEKYQELADSIAKEPEKYKHLVK